VRCRQFINLSVWGINTAAAAVIPHHPSPLWAWSYGPLAAFLALDFLSYALHRVQHLPPFWRFHRLHHNDDEVDITTAVRHNPIEHLLALGVFTLAIWVCGFPAEILAVSSLVTLALAAATHTKRRWPVVLERIVRPVIITRREHLAHHSFDPAEYNTNFGAIFPWWDMLCGTYRRI
jgi:sterol desaturase/sphingolipid hydroxylase (fatty acid hydroxylase superfamily)